MLVFQWNALRIGDHVLVHDDLDRHLALREGIVRMVEPHNGGTNDVAVRLARGQVVRPRRHAVHLLPIDGESCWRCEVIAAGSGRSRVAA